MEQKRTADYSCKEIVSELDKYIISQKEAKKHVAIALRNRYRRSKLNELDKEEITPKNIIMRGPTGVGKTEIARRLAKLVGAPFVKVEATKYTEVGYVGRDVESMVKDLVEAAIRLVKEEKFKDVETKAKTSAENKIIDILIAAKKVEQGETPLNIFRDKIVEEYKSGKLEDFLVEANFEAPVKNMEIGIGNGPEIDLGSIFGSMLGGSGGRKIRKKLTVKQAREMLISEECERLIDMDTIKQDALKRAENDGIIFIDEFDKIAARSRGTSSGGPDVSREGVQRDILPIVEGTVVNTKHGQIKTDYILFIAAGAFHMTKFEDLIPELQGRFPIRVELENLTAKDFERILIEPKNNLIDQQKKLLAVDNVKLTFTKDAIETIAKFSESENQNTENLGARRLHSVLETILEEISFNAAPDIPETEVKVTKEFVDNILGKLTSKKKTPMGFKN